MFRRVVNVTGVVLPPHAALRRRAPRPTEHQQDNYFDLFDAETVYCDVVLGPQGLEMIGPPLFNLTETFMAATYTVDGQDVAGVVTTALDRAQRTVLPLDAPGDEVVIRFGEHVMNAPIRHEMAQPFAGKRVLLAMQRNNPLPWLREWVEAYVALNGVDAVVMYDLISTSYSEQTLLETLSSVPGLDAVVVVRWPYKYGVQPAGPGTPWDSDFGQYVAWEHARRRFLRLAEAVTVSDVDELFLAEDGRSIFEHAAESPTGSVYFNQRFIETAVEQDPTDSTETSYGSYVFYEPDKPLSTQKYAAVMDRLGDTNQLLVHSIRRVAQDPTDAIVGRQFLAMKLNWGRGRFDRRYPDSIVGDRPLKRDEGLEDALRRVAQWRTTTP